MSDAHEDAEQLFRHNAAGARTYYRLALSRGMSRPVVFLLDLHDPLSRALVDGCGGPGTAEAALPLANAAAGEIPTGILPLPLETAANILGDSAPELSEMRAGTFDLRGKIPVVVVTGGKVGVDTIPAATPGAN